MFWIFMMVNDSPLSSITLDILIVPDSLDLFQDACNDVYDMISMTFYFDQLPRKY